MNTKSTFLKLDLQMLNQPNNFEDALSSRDDLQGFLQPTSPPLQLTKVSSWHSFHSFLAADASHNQAGSLNASPSDTPQSSPATNRKQLDASKLGFSSEHLKKRWFNSPLLTTFSESNIASAGNLANQLDTGDGYNRKNSSYKNVSNFDINVIGPISF